MRFDDLLDIGEGDPSIPDPIGIYHDGGPVFALIEAPRHVGSHALLESSQRELLLEKKLQLSLAGWIAAAARMSRLALVAADEQVFLELGHIAQCTRKAHKEGRRRFKAERDGLLFWLNPSA